MSEQPEFGQRQQEPVCKFVKAPARNKNFRKRTHDEDGDEDEDKTVESAVISKRKQQKDKGLSFSTGASKWYSEADNEEDVKQPIFQFESSKEIQVHNDNKATATLETETDFSRDARATIPAELNRNEPRSIDS